MSIARSTKLHEFAGIGAQTRLQELKNEISSILKIFPHLRYGAAVRPSMPDAVEERKPLRRRKLAMMSAEARTAVSVRMEKYCAAKRKAAKG